LTEEEYILRLDDVANTLKCWGAVSHIRNSLEKSKERPRIGKVKLSSSFIRRLLRKGRRHNKKNNKTMTAQSKAAYAN